MTVNISGPFSGHGPTIVPVQVQGASRVRETRIAITDDQATRLRAMVNALEGRPIAAAAPAPAPAPVQRPAPAPKPHPVIAHPPAHAAPVTPPRTARVIAVSSGKGGVGKTNTSVNLAIAMTQLGRKVTLLDADLGMANADVLCGLTPTRRLEHFLGVADRTSAGGQASRLPAGGTAASPSAIADLAVDAPGGFRLIPGSVGISRMTELSPTERERLLAGLAELDASTDLIIVDTGAGLGREVLSFARAADMAVVIATPEPTSIADAYALIKCILKRDDKARPLRPQSPGGESLPRVALVVNQASGPSEAQAVHTRMASVCLRFLAYPLPLLGWIPQDARVPLAIRKRSPLLVADPGAAASHAVRTLAQAIAGELRLKVQAPLGVVSRLPDSTPGPSPRRQGGLSGFLSRVLRGG